MGKERKTSKPAFDLEQAIVQEDIRTGLQIGVEKLAGSAERPQQTDHFHNTKYLLQQYRRVAYAVKLSESDLNIRMEMEYGTSLSTLEANAELAGVDISNTKLENYTRTVIRSKQMMAIIHNALECVSEDPDRGDMLFEVLNQTYIVSRKPKDREQILRELEKKGYFMSLASYHIYLNKAIRALDRILWGYTARDCMEIIKRFLPDD